MTKSSKCWGVRRPRAALRALALISAAALSTTATSVSVRAQGLAEPKAIETIIDSDVREREVETSATSSRVIAAIEKTTESATAVRKASKLDRVDIVFLADATAAEGGPPAQIEEKLKQHADAIDLLRKEIEGNAMLYHAIDSRQVMLRDVLAVEFDDANRAVIFAAAKPPG